MATTAKRAEPLVRLDDFEAAARAILPTVVFDYIAGGAEDEAAVRGNREGLARLRFRFRVLAGADDPDLSNVVVGHRYTMPVHIAPAAIHRMCHPDGEAATYRAASEAGAGFVLSTMASLSMEEVAAAATGPRWFQLYMPGRRELGSALIERAEAAGYTAIMLTVDLPKTGRRERDVRNEWALPEGVRYANFGDWTVDDQVEGGDPFARDINSLIDPRLNWDDLDWLIGKTTLPVLLKGVVRADDARRALDAGVQGLVVSNHGGRQLDYSIATIDALPQVVEAVGGKIPVLVDGGFRRGTDVVKALCLGASGVLIGRPYLYALAVDGAEGVRTLLSLLREEIALSMTLLGVRSLSELSRDLLA